MAAFPLTQGPVPRLGNGKVFHRHSANRILSSDATRQRVIPNALEQIPNRKRRLPVPGVADRKTISRTRVVSTVVTGIVPMAR